METAIESASQPELNDPDDSLSTPNPSDHHDLVAEVESLRQSLQTLKSTMEENILRLEHQRDEAINHNVNLTKIVDEISFQRDSLRDKVNEFEVSIKERDEEFVKRIDEEIFKKEEVTKQVEVSREKTERLEVEKKEKIEFLLKIVNSLRLVKECLVKTIKSLDDEKVIERENDEEENSGLELEQEWRAIWEEINAVKRLSSEAESKVSENRESWKKEKQELENSLVSLTEENRDINNLLRVALVEKEAVEKSLNRLKGNNEQKRVPLLQFARVGFGFMMGSGSPEQLPESSEAASTMGSKSDSSECEEEVVSLASTVEKIMKNLRLEISQLRRSLEESRSDNERLQSLTEKQAQKIEENMLYIRELEDRESVLVRNIEELLTEMKETEAEVARWREACELEVKAGKNEVDERDKVVSILKQELEKTKAALDISNGKLRLKEDLVAAAMVAQATAERSLQLADSRAAELRERIEELTKQSEEADSKEKNSRRRVRHICWPWRAVRLNPLYNRNTTLQNVKRMLPEMQALLR
ncbi:hypothetical protein CFOL_v3_22773 [Cephalotus follicularis]|uniref:Uncharacterized protein n=1 Tax=Cephalotus follicularis TaxID=3775 RepID=A0A1Q3CGS1_CEPFO|nr:hypothetical protein CFOL_v3_22773 [Cephalotus follicularis]